VSRVPTCVSLFFKGSMASAARDSDSNDSNAEASPKRVKSRGESPEQPGQSDQPGPAESDEDSEVYEIEAILDAKRGATGSVRFLRHSSKKNRVLLPSKDQNRLPCQMERLSQR
jgi:hypothetical protein